MSKIKEFYNKPNVKELVLLIVNSAMAGFVLSMAGVAYLWANANIPGMGKLAGSFFFSCGLLVIILFDYKLFTGMISNLPYSQLKKSWHLIICFVFNALGCLLGAWLFRNTSIAVTGTIGVNGLDTGLIGLATATMNSKTDANAFQMFASAIFCGMCITIAVLGCRGAKDKKFSATFFVVLPIMVFVYCGFEHSVANWIYLFLSGIKWTGKVWLLTGMGILGNLVGGVPIPLACMVAGKKYLPLKAPQAEVTEEAAPAKQEEITVEAK
jgi:formate/nitrite transporter FocA (FNT family)